jgi:DNA-directed RNA polymerase specialized sigma subunit
MAEARSRLPERDRQILDWRYPDQLTLECIGEKLGISAVAVHKAHRRALERLEDAFLDNAEACAHRQTRSGLRLIYVDGSQA